MTRSSAEIPSPAPLFFFPPPGLWTHCRLLQCLSCCKERFHRMLLNSLKAVDVLRGKTGALSTER